MTEKKSYFAVIPASVRYDEELSPNAKLLYGEITALCSSEGYCWATNKYFADLYGVTGTTVSLWIKSLVDRGHIQSKIVYKEGTKEIQNRYLTILKDPIQDFLNTPMQENLKDNNTSFNNTSNITNESNSMSVKPTKSPKHKHGMYNNVLLSDEEMEKLQNEFPYDWQERIERLSEYIASKGAKYKDHLATIRSWARKDKDRQQQPRQAERQKSNNVFLDILNGGFDD